MYSTCQHLKRGAVWVYVLERRRAIEVWNTIMGDPDPETARETSATSLRALYGISKEQNAVMGSPDGQTAEVQIASLFASSPPFPATELPDHLVSPIDGGSMRSVSSSVLSALRRTSDDMSRSQAHGGSSGGRRTSNEGMSTPSFKARPIPASHVTPTIAPRTTRAANLRAGIVPESPERTRGARAAPSKEKLAQMFANVPGHKRSDTIAVASTAPPVVAPRMTRAASLRLGQTPVTPPRPRPSADTGREKTFEGVPGHKRRESISVASTKAPTVTPRLNKSAALRVQKEKEKEATPPSSFNCKCSSWSPLRSVMVASSHLYLFSSTLDRAQMKSALHRERQHRSRVHPRAASSPLLVLPRLSQARHPRFAQRPIRMVRNSPPPPLRRQLPRSLRNHALRACRRPSWRRAKTGAQCFARPR